MTTNRKVSEPVEVEVSTTIPQSSTKKEKVTTVEIVTKQSFKMMYGDRWYYFTKGEPVAVTQEIKDYLLKQDALAVI